MVNQEKDLILGGAQTFQTEEQMVEEVATRNWALYADLAEYCPLSVIFHLISSTMSKFNFDALNSRVSSVIVHT
jgi:hypothetical protein